MKHHLRRVVWALLLVTSLGCANKPQDPKKKSDAYRVTSPNLFLWEIASAKTKIYLLGSVHIGTDELYPLPEEITDALASSRRLVVEANLETVDPAEVKRFVAEKGMYGKGGRLTEHLSKETAEKVRAYCESSGLPLAQLEQYKPWVAEMMIVPAALMKAGYSPEHGIDLHLIRRAADLGKPVDELETAQDQLEMFASIPEELHEAMLLNMLQQLSDIEPQMDQLIAAWVNGDAEKMNKLMRVDPLAEEPRLKPLYVIVFDKRNVAMTAKIEQYLKGTEPVFVAVGAGHITGETGILKLLEQKGYSVKQLQRRK